MLHPAFAAPGAFYRGNLHCHSNRSDGVLDPGEVCRRYKAEGYDFIALTDHFVGRFDYPITDTTSFRDEVFTTLLGAELHSGAMENGELWHILAVGLPSDFAPSHSPDFHPVEGQETGPEIARRARDAGAFVAIAHPHWSGMTPADARGIDAAHAVEIYNHTCAVGTDRGEGGHMADLLLSDGQDLSLIATDDAHFKGPDHFGGWVMVKAEANEPDLLLEALKAGHFYASQGPDLKAVALNDGHVDVSCSAATTVLVQGHGSATAIAHGAALTQARIPLERLKNSPWLRVTVVDRAGKRAWSNPMANPIYG
ncbi:CehA/McbA family metallohydrolase [Phaeobacter sp. QD34_3]|uniref:CehA/McbA family metallohydrolase n=1 Tax=unclassified Phaeobacter TaxID=2621772 RepID=UPI00237F1452|nr:MULTISPECIES: CehA/McbA family metallohydrolase [unclassified Phaeobacter]MDE4134929.1 CehA/McbA family metallohydrolase [Phaeobacter sp. QD34_3]MDE4138559.1 CehA/McbA family metallohydrolase [Phaeobacter sp. QD34_24]